MNEKNPYFSCSSELNEFKAKLEIQTFMLDKFTCRYDFRERMSKPQEELFPSTHFHARVQQYS